LPPFLSRGRKNLFKQQKEKKERKDQVASKGATARSTPGGKKRGIYTFTKGKDPLLRELKEKTGQGTRSTTTGSAGQTTITKGETSLHNHREGGNAIGECYDRGQESQGGRLRGETRRGRETKEGEAVLMIEKTDPF